MLMCVCACPSPRGAVAPRGAARPRRTGRAIQERLEHGRRRYGQAGERAQALHKHRTMVYAVIIACAMASLFGTTRGHFSPPPPTMCNPNTKPPQFCPNGHPCPSCGQAECMCPPPGPPTPPPPPSPNITYVCDATQRRCSVGTSSGHQFANLSSCQDACTGPVVRFGCDTTSFRCVEGQTGNFSQLADCQTACVSYSCDLAAHKCVKDPTPRYNGTVLDECQQHCNAGSGCQNSAECLHGVCTVDHKCYCEVGYTGKRCETKAPPFEGSRIIANSSWPAIINSFVQKPANQSWALCYSSFTDPDIESCGSKCVQRFHRQCDEFSDTVTIARNEQNYIFGGYVRCLRHPCASLPVPFRRNGCCKMVVQRTH
eukprot:COSAG02_NODE_2741_length_8123_cov_5.360793_2_plen_371_part_00